MEKISQQIPMQKINVDSNPELQARYGVRNIPTVILIRDGGVELDRKVGVNPIQIYIDMYNQN
jgi:thioredoxin-like negative regulator of GroEL